MRVRRNRQHRSHRDEPAAPVFLLQFDATRLLTKLALDAVVPRQTLVGIREVRVDATENRVILDQDFFKHQHRLVFHRPFQFPSCIVGRPWDPA